MRIERASQRASEQASKSENVTHSPTYGAKGSPFQISATSIWALPVWGRGLARMVWGTYSEKMVKKNGKNGKIAPGKNGKIAPEKKCPRVPV